MKNSKIEWTDHTFNPWIGCTKVSPGCANCYAASLDHRWGHDSWGPGKPRRRTSAANWKQPLKWDREAARERDAYQQAARDGMVDELNLTEPRRPRVFCASLADWLDDEVPIAWLADLLDLIRRTPNLDWLLLTKRPQNWYKRVSAVDSEFAESWIDCIDMPERGDIPPNIWVGTTVEDQARADERIPHLLRIPARVRFLSCEPLLGPVDFSRIPPVMEETIPGIGWVICGGESGPKARPIDLAWARSLKDQCEASGVPFFMKQLGGVRDKRHELEDLPEDLRIRQFPGVQP